MEKERQEIRHLISLFDRGGFKKSITPIQCFIVPGNDHVKESRNGFWIIIWMPARFYIRPCHSERKDYA